MHRIISRVILSAGAFLLCGALSTSVFAQEQETLSLSLEEAQQMAVDRNITLANAALDVKAAKAKKWAAIAEMLPQVSASGEYSDFLGYKMDLGGMSIAMPPYINAGVRTSLAFGGPLFVAAQISEISKVMSDINLKQSEQDITTQVKTLYYSALVSQEVLELLNLNLENLNRLYDMTMTSVRVGAAEQTAADQIAVQVAQLENSVASNKRSLEMVYNSLRLQLDLDVDSEIVLTDKLEDLMAIDDFLLLLTEDFDVRNNYGYQLAEQNAALGKKQLTAAKLATTPTLAAYHQYSHKMYLSDEKTMNMTPPNMIGATLTIPLFTSLKSNMNINAARDAYQKSLNTLSNTEKALLVQHRQLCYNLSSAYDTYNAQLKNMDVTQRVFDNVSKKFEQGYASAMELTQSGTELIGAQSNYIQAILQFVNAQIELEKLLNKK